MISDALHLLKKSKVIEWLCDVCIAACLCQCTKYSVPLEHRKHPHFLPSPFQQPLVMPLYTIRSVHVVW